MSSDTPLDRRMTTETVEIDPTDELPMPHIVRVEINVSAVIQEPNGNIFGKNMIDATLGFGWRTAEPPRGATDAQVNGALNAAMSPVLALIQTSMTFQGWVPIGQVDEPMLKSPATVVGGARSLPVTVRVDFPDEGNAVHD